ncbi:hypothetical protein BHE74_00021629 [Ensete ventricosum]|nr:hypothetical protein BHE74_00021629 [Ensete ventricosum]
MPPPPPRVGRRYAAIDQSSVDRLKDEVGAVQGFRCHPCWLGFLLAFIPPFFLAEDTFGWSSRAPRAVSWSLRPILSRGPPWTISCPGSKPWSRGSDIIRHRCLSSNPPNGPLS